jgi:hypothetical protein
MTQKTTFQHSPTSLEELARAMRTSACVGPMATLHLTDKTLLEVARRIEDGGPRFVVVDRERPSALSKLGWCVVIAFHVAAYLQSAVLHLLVAL